MPDKPDSKDINNDLSSEDEIIEEIISELPLRERVIIANMNKEDVKTLKNVFDKYFREKNDAKLNDSEYNDMINNLKLKLQKTHKIRVVK